MDLFGDEKVTRRLDAKEIRRGFARPVGRGASIRCPASFRWREVYVLVPEGADCIWAFGKKEIDILLKAVRKAPDGGAPMYNFRWAAEEAILRLRKEKRIKERDFFYVLNRCRHVKEKEVQALLDKMEKEYGL